MQQHEFIWLVKNFNLESTQDDIGNTFVQLRPSIQISHNYKKKDPLSLIFQEDNTTYLIPNRYELEQVIKLHLSNENLGQILRKYCEDNLA